MEKEKVSVLMSVYFKEKSEYLDESLNSIKNQTYEIDELVLVKDGPLTNELEVVIQKYKNILNIKEVQLVKNVGLGLALREGVVHCSNEIIIRMDSDDISREDRVEKQVKILKENEEIGIIGSNSENFSEKIGDLKVFGIYPEKDKDIRKFMKRRCPFLHPTVALKKSKIIKCGNYENLYWFEDYDLFFRILKCTEGYNIQENLLYFRANKEMYARRGGIGYIKKEIKALTKFYKRGDMTLYYYLTNLFIRLGIRLCGSKVRGIIYKKILRREKL